MIFICYSRRLPSIIHMRTTCAVASSGKSGLNGRIVAQSRSNASVRNMNSVESKPKEAPQVVIQSKRNKNENSIRFALSGISCVSAGTSQYTLGSGSNRPRRGDMLLILDKIIWELNVSVNERQRWKETSFFSRILISLRGRGFSSFMKRIKAGMLSFSFMIHQSSSAFLTIIISKDYRFFLPNL